MFDFGAVCVSQPCLVAVVFSGSSLSEEVKFYVNGVENYPGPDSVHTERNRIYEKETVRIPFSSDCNGCLDISNYSFLALGEIPSGVESTECVTAPSGGRQAPRTATPVVARRPLAAAKRAVAEAHF